jgi:hypothetical protein
VPWQVSLCRTHNTRRQAAWLLRSGQEDVCWTSSMLCCAMVYLAHGVLMAAWLQVLKPWYLCQHPCTGSRTNRRRRCPAHPASQHGTVTCRLQVV